MQQPPPPTLWIVVADYAAVKAAFQPLVDEGKLKEVVHGNSFAEFESAFTELKKNIAMDQCQPMPRIVFALASPAVPEVLQPLLADPTTKPCVAWIHSLFTGVDAFKLSAMDPKLLEGVRISNAHGVFSHILAEHVMFSILYFLRRTVRLQNNQQQRVWVQSTNPVMRDLKLGVLGYGDIGKVCATMAKQGFRVSDVQGWRRSGTGEADDIGTRVVGGQEGFDDTLSRSDIILNVLPKTDDTYHLVNKTAFAKMKPNCIFINIGRGSTVCEADLAEALNNNIIAAAALDVFEKEPLDQDNPLYSVKDLNSKLLMTPHDADAPSSCPRGLIAAQQFASEIGLFVSSGGNLDHMKHWIDPAKGY